MERKRLWYILIIVFLVAVLVGFLLTCGMNQTQPEKSPSDMTPTVVQRVESIQGVNGADAIILNRVALIVIDLKTGLPKNRIDEIKRRAARTADDVPNVSEVLVTADPKIADEVRRILAGEEPLEALERIYVKLRAQT